jgi:hypothetical protein
MLERLGLAWNVMLPEHLQRAGRLTRVVHDAHPAAAPRASLGGV